MAAAAAVAVLVAVVTSTLGPDEPAATGRVALAAPSPGASAEDAPTPEPSKEPTAAPAPTRSPAAGEPSSPPSSEPDAPTSAPRAPQPEPAPASPRPRPPAPAPASPPPPSPAAPARAAFAFDAAYGTDEPREVVVQYGDSSSCPHARVTHTVRESADRVVVTLEADATDPGRACTADYRQRLVPVALQSPLGDRVLVDGSRGEPVPVDRSCQRPFENPPPPEDCEP